jgi:2-polyprenyl-3-methyl-5-hydroxy-6-metoxy-1,4-benzoquinol methylase
MDISKYWTDRILTFDRRLLSYNNCYDTFFPELDMNSSYLEIGPGNGSFARYVADKFSIPDSSITLVDLSSSMIEKLKFQEETRAFNLVLDDSIQYLGKTDKKYDCIVLRHVLEHMERDYISRLVPILEKRLSQNWHILVEVPNVGNIPYWFYQAYWDFSHVTQFTYESLVEAFRWNLQGEFDIRTFNVVHPIDFISKPAFLEILKSLIARIFFYLSVAITFSLLRIMGDKSWTGQVYTPYILMVVKR